MPCDYVAYKIEWKTSMSLKLSILSILILSISIIPSVTASIHMTYTHNEPDHNRLLFNGTAILIRGRISNVTLHEPSYMAPYYTFACEDVTCIYGVTDPPVIRRFTHQEQFIICALQGGEYYYVFFGSHIIAMLPLFFWFLLVWFDITNP